MEAAPRARGLLQLGLGHTRGNRFGGEDRLGHVLPDELLLAEAEHRADPFVPTGCPPVAIGHEDRVVLHLLDQGAIALLAFAQGRGSRFPLFQVRPGLVLPLAVPQSGASAADQGGDPRRPLQQHHVAQQPHRTSDERGFQVLSREQDDRQIGPGRLTGHPLDEQIRSLDPQPLLGHQQRRRAALQLGDHIRKVATDVRCKAILLEHVPCQCGILGGRGEDQQAAFERVFVGGGHGLVLLRRRIRASHRRNPRKHAAEL